MRVEELAARFKTHYSRARELSKEDLSQYLFYTALAMECFQAANSLIALAEYYVSEKGLGFPA